MAVEHSVLLQRLARARDMARKNNLSALIIYAAPVALGNETSTAGNVRYLTDWAGRFNPSLLVVPLDSDPVLILYPSLLNARWALEKDIWLQDIRGVPGPREQGAEARAVLLERCQQRDRVGLIGVGEMTLAIHRGLASPNVLWEFVEVDDLFALQRIIKGPEEIRAHRAAAKISDAMLFAVMSGARAPGKWAYQLMADMESMGRSLGAEVAAGWLAVGPEEFLTLDLWQNMRQVKNGDRVSAGTYIQNDGYWGHGLRMGMRGKASRKLRHYAEAILKVQEAGVRALQPGVPLSAVRRSMDSLIDEYSPYGAGSDPFRVRPGHGLGLAYGDIAMDAAFPQAPGAGGRATGRRNGDTELPAQPGMVLELHPNFSVPGLGFITTGDTVLVTESGAELLTRFPRGLYDI